MPSLRVRRGVLGNVLFSFALVVSLLLLVVLGKVLELFSSFWLIVLFMSTFLRTGFIGYALYVPIRRRMTRLYSLALTLIGLLAFNYSLPELCDSLQYVILQVFLQEWSRNEEEENYIERYFMDGYERQLGGSFWMLSMKLTFGYLFIHEALTFGLLFPYGSAVSDNTTPFHDFDDGYNALLHFSQPSPVYSHTLQSQTQRYPLELERELESKVSRIDYVTAIPTCPPDPAAPEGILQSEIPLSSQQSVAQNYKQGN